MTYQFTAQQNVQVLSFEGNILDGAKNDAVLSEVKQLITEGNNHFIIDFSKSKFINSSGLSLIINILTTSRKNSGESILVNVTEDLQKLLELTRLNSIFTIRKTIEDGISAIAQTA